MFVAIPKCFNQEIVNANLRVYSEECFLHPKKVIFNEPATIVLWSDGTKTVVKRQEDDAIEFDPEVGYAMCYLKKLLGNTGSFNKIFRNKAYLEAMESIDESSSTWGKDFMTKCWNVLVTDDDINKELSVGYKKEAENV